MRTSGDWDQRENEEGGFCGCLLSFPSLFSLSCFFWWVGNFVRDNKQISKVHGCMDRERRVLIE